MKEVKEMLDKLLKRQEKLDALIEDLQSIIAKAEGQKTLDEE